MERRVADLNLLHEPLDEVLVDDAVWGGEEGQHVRDEVLLVRLQSLPVLYILHNKIQLKARFSDPYSSDTKPDPAL